MSIAPLLRAARQGLISFSKNLAEVTDKNGKLLFAREKYFFNGVLKRQDVIFKGKQEYIRKISKEKVLDASGELKNSTRTQLLTRSNPRESFHTVFDERRIRA